jgi:hypothetical protein
VLTPRCGLRHGDYHRFLKQAAIVEILNQGRKTGIEHRG